MPTSERDHFIVRFDKPHAKDMGTFGAGQFHNRPVLYSFKTKQGLPVFWVLPPDYFANGWGGGINIWQSLKLGSQQADLGKGQSPLLTRITIRHCGRRDGKPERRLRVAMRTTTIKVDCRKATGELSFPKNCLWLHTLDVDINTIIRNEHSTGSNAIFSQGSNALKITIRPENEADHLAVEVLTREAFWNLYRPGCDEHYTTHLIRGHEDFLPDLTFVAEVDGDIVGSIMYTRSWVIDELDERVETATFGPLCVHPAWQRQGVGSALIGHSRALAAEKGYPAIIILGDPHNYCKHGFKTGKDLGVCTLDGKFPLGLLVLELRQGFFASSRQWKFQTSKVYEFDAAQVEVYDARFPPKEKKYQYSQELFAMLVRAVVE